MRSGTIWKVGNMITEEQQVGTSQRQKMHKYLILRMKMRKAITVSRIKDASLTENLYNGFEKKFWRDSLSMWRTINSFRL